MKRILLLTGIVSSLLFAGCASSNTDADVAAEYGLTTEQYIEMKAAAEGMNMNVEDHLKMMGYTPKQ